MTCSTISAIITRGYGSYSVVNFVPTQGYGNYCPVVTDSPGGGVDPRYGDKDFGWKYYLKKLEEERERELARKISEIAPIKEKAKAASEFAKTEEYRLLSLKEQKLIAELIVISRLEYELKLKLAWEKYLEDESLSILLLSIH